MNTEYDTGVSNGDVDWLFRGKSKKLTKHMNSEAKKQATEAKEKERKEDKPGSSGSKTAGTETARHESSRREVSGGSGKIMDKRAEEELQKALDKRPEKKQEGKAEKKSENYPDGTAEKRLDKKLQKMPEMSNFPDKESYSGSEKLKRTPGGSRSHEKGSEKSAFDKLFGRSRSHSTGSTNFNAAHVDDRAKRKSSNVPLPGSASVSPSSTGNTPTGSGGSSSQDGSQSLSRSNSNSGKTKSIFSSISAKLRPSTASSNSTTESVVSQTPQASSPHGTMKLTSGTPQKRNKDDDLARLVDEPPLELPRNARNRRSSSIARRRSEGNKKRHDSYDEVSGDVAPRKNDITLKRVAFAIQELAYDPQQQIPSRRPHKGNVIVPEDLLAPPPRLSQGITTSDGKAKVAPEVTCTDKELALAHESRKNSIKEAERHAQAAHIAATRLAQEVSLFKHTKKNKAREDIEDNEALAEESDKIVEGIEIDKPLHVHEINFADENHPDEDEEDENEDLVIQNLSLETIYTRCCHLREILPIPATLKQLKNKSKPLQVLKMLNPKPTLIEILSFCDFVAITEINTIIFDNVIMTTEMLKCVLCSIIKNRYTYKLSLRNVSMDELGWKYLCEFMKQNRSIKKLDISQQKVKPETKKLCIRSNMNWQLFIDAIASRGGIEELVINGCKLSDSIFEDLIKSAVKLSTYRLGVASTELNIYKARILADWVADPQSKCVGVDLAFNDLSNGQLKEFIKVFYKGTLKLLFFSLNSTYLSNLEEASDLLRALVNVKTLKFLDLSSLPDLFPAIIPKLDKYLPQFHELRRIHFDLNDLSAHSISAIADILPKIPNLLHASFLGNSKVEGACVALYAATKHAKYLYTLDLDYSLIPDELSQRMAFYLMRNLDRNVNAINTNVTYDGGVPRQENDQEELMFDGKLLMEAAEKMLCANENSNTEFGLKTQIMVTNALIERTRAVRSDLHHNIDILFQKRNEGALSFDGKETLLRLCLLDSSLEKLVHMFEDQAKKVSSMSKEVVLGSPTSVNHKADATPDNNHLKPPANNHKPTSINLHNESLHQGSNEYITAGHILSPQNVEDLNLTGYFQSSDLNFQPHQVVVDATSDGRNIPVDNLTGRPVLMKSLSHTSLQAKIQEEEEGELHRFGFFMQQMGNDSSEAISKGRKDLRKDGGPSELPALNFFPSGTELRDSIIAAKGIESVQDLIENINNNSVSIEKVFKMTEKGKEKETGKAKDADILIPGSSLAASNDALDNESIDSNGNDLNLNSSHEINAKVDEVYDKLLNDAQRVRSNKQE